MATDLKAQDFSDGEDEGTQLSHPFAAFSKEECEKEWKVRFVEAFGPTNGAAYAKTFAHNEIPHDHVEPLTSEELKEMGIVVGHRKEVKHIIGRLRSATHEEGDENTGQGRGRSNSQVAPGDLIAAGEKFTLPNSKHSLKTGAFIWQDFEGVAETYEAFLESAGETMLSRNTRDEVPNHFMRAFYDNKPMPFFIKSHTKSGKVCAMLVLRLPSLELTLDPMTIKDSTMATMTNRLVFIYTPRSTRGGKLITYHKDTTQEIPWLKAVKAKWGELEDLSRERLFMHLVSEALMISSQVLESYRMQLESLIDVPVSYASTSVVEWMSLINRQSQVLKRCLVANSSACEGLNDVLQMDAQTTLSVAVNLAARADEVECNAMDAMNLRMGLCGFRANENMKFFTFVSAITAPLGVMTGWYGMNFEFIPELKDENAQEVFGIILMPFSSHAFFLSSFRW